MRIEAYFRQIERIIEACPVIQLSNLTYEKRGTHEGFIRGELYFVDGSTFHSREFVDVEITADRFKKLGLSTFPHHKHDGSEDNVIPSAAPNLAFVLQEIESLVQLP